MQRPYDLPNIIDGVGHEHTARFKQERSRSSS